MGYYSRFSVAHTLNTTLSFILQQVKDHDVYEVRNTQYFLLNPDLNVSNHSDYLLRNTSHSGAS